METDPSIVERLGQIGLFAGCNVDELHGIVAVGRESRASAGATIAKQGEVGEDGILILDGQVTVRRGGRQITYLATSGEGVRIGSLRAGDLVGEISLLDNGPRTATVVCDTDCRLFHIPRQHFVEFLRANPDVALQLLSNLAQLVRELDRQFDD